MKNKLLQLSFIIIAAASFISCSDHIVPDFTISPEMPVCGQKVTFTNTTIGDEDWTGKYWNWTFGDDTKSISKSPTHIYKLPGKYTITMRVDSNDNYIKTKELIVYDSIPTIYTDDDSVKYYQKTNISALVYNPYGYDITYKWTFSENAHSDSIVNGSSTAAEFSVYFSKHDVNEIVKLHVTVGDSVYDVVDTIYIHDYKAKSLMMTQKNSNVLRQRIYFYGTEDAVATTIPSGKNGLNFCSRGNYAFLFNAGEQLSPSTTGLGDGSIKVINLKTDQTSTVVSNSSSAAAYTFYTGSVDNNYIYWADYQNYIYKLPVTAENQNFEWSGDATQPQKSYYVARANRLGYFGNGLANGQLNGGIAFCDGAYFWAKGGTGRGIYRFEQKDILNSDVTGAGTPPSFGAILTDFAIRAFAIDEINQKIYFSVTAPADKVGFWVANIGGSSPKRIDDAPVDDEMLYITGIAIDNESNRVYWAYRSPETIGAAAPSGGSWETYYESYPTHRTGVKMAQLATLYKPAGAIEYFAPGVAAYGIALDEVKK